MSLYTMYFTTSTRRSNSSIISSWVRLRISMILSNRKLWPLYTKRSPTWSHSYTVLDMSSLVSGSNPTISITCFIRRVSSLPTLTCDWMITLRRAVRRMRGQLMGSFSSLLTIDCTESACIVE